MLTDRTKIEFEKWLKQNYHAFSYIKFNDEYDAHFYKLPFNMQYGVYVDFFDSVGIYIQNVFSDFEDKEWEVFIQCEDDYYDTEIYDLKSRKEAQEQAINQANIIYNNLKQ